MSDIKPKAVLLIGLPGSGKTYHAKEKYVPLGYVLIDDPSVSTTDAYRLMMHTIRVTKENIVVTDPNLCSLRSRQLAIDLFTRNGYDVEVFYFKNDEASCAKNIKRRNDDRIINSFKAFQYEIPADGKVLEVYAPNNLDN